MKATNLTLESAMTKKGGIAAFTAVSVVIVNGISMAVVLKTKAINTKLKVFFIGQLLTDLVLGMVGLLMSLVNLFLDSRELYLCLTANNIGYICAVVTSFMAIIQAMDRFLVLRCTFRYTAWVTATKATFIIVFVYIMTSVLFSILFNLNSEVIGCSMMSFGNKSGYFFFACVLSCNLGIAFCLHLYVWIKVKSHMKRISSVGFCEEVVFTAKDTRNLATMLITVSFICICYLPCILTIFYLVLFAWDWERRLVFIQGPFPGIALNLYMANSFINPLVYIWRLKYFRLECTRKFYSCVGR